MARQFRDTDPSSLLRRRIAYGKLQGQADAFKRHRDEMRLLSPPECKTFLNGRPYEGPKPGPRVEMLFEAARSTLDIPRVRMPRRDPQTPNVANCVALDVPENQLQMVKYQKAVEERGKFAWLTYRRRFMVSCPSPMETWRLEKEYVDYRAAAHMLKIDFLNENAYHKTRKALREFLAGEGITLEQRRRGLLKSRGRGSPLKEVISIDEDWPQ